MAPLPPVRKRASYADVGAGDLVFALFQDRIAPAGAMQLDSQAIKAHDDELDALDQWLDLVDALDEVATKHMPGGHDQRSHGRSTARRAASRSAYSQARAGGASVAEARTAARDVSTAIANKQRMRNIERELDGKVSDRQRSSLEAEHARLKADTSERVSRASKLAPDAADVALNHNPEATNKGRQGKLNQLDQQHSYMQEQRRIAANKVADAQQKVDRAQAEYDRYIAQGVKPSKLTYEKRELAEAKRDLAHWKSEQRMVDKNAKQVEKDLQGELNRPANLQRRADRAASDAWLAAYKEPGMTREQADQRAAAAREKVLQEGAPKPAGGRTRKEPAAVDPARSALQDRHRVATENLEAAQHELTRREILYDRQIMAGVSPSKLSREKRDMEEAKLAVVKARADYRQAEADLQNAAKPRGELTNAQRSKLESERAYLTQEYRGQTDRDRQRVAEIDQQLGTTPAAGGRDRAKVQRQLDQVDQKLADNRSRAQRLAALHDEFNERRAAGRLTPEEIDRYRVDIAELGGTPRRQAEINIAAGRVKELAAEGSRLHSTGQGSMSFAQREAHNAKVQANREAFQRAKAEQQRLHDDSILHGAADYRPISQADPRAVADAYLSDRRQPGVNPERVQKLRDRAVHDAIGDVSGEQRATAIRQKIREIEQRDQVLRERLANAQNGDERNRIQNERGALPGQARALRDTAAAEGIAVPRSRASIESEIQKYTERGGYNAAGKLAQLRAELAALDE